MISQWDTEMGLVFDSVVIRCTATDGLAVFGGSSDECTQDFGVIWRCIGGV